MLPSFGKYPIPVSISVTEAVPYELVPRTRTEQEAMALAYGSLEKEISALSADVTILRKQIRTEVTEDGVRLICRLETVENIAHTQEFEIGE